MDGTKAEEPTLEINNAKYGKADEPAVDGNKSYIVPTLPDFQF